MSPRCVMCRLISMTTSTGGQSPAGARKSGRHTVKAADSRKRQREQDSSSIVLEESPQRLLCEDADVPLEWSSSPQPSTTSPQARLDGVLLEVSAAPQEAAGSQQEDQSTDLQDPVDDGIVSLSLWPTPLLVPVQWSSSLTLRRCG
ncbi:hypothetical protein EXN66_Car007035 [Channa argus]|uniref:Uncharacterized protein n=1 Tax=Channa argus TaxID=215402 RepID=A0A6G1PM28_CHAAH|nr:hypothetical protein EXN66_Car007035 [Channa argus]